MKRGVFNMADNKHLINCPACGSEMEKVFLPDAGIYVDICLNGCGGIYFDNRELEKVDEKHERIDAILNAIKNKNFKYVDTTEKRICPVCNTPMVKHFMSAKKEVEIDDCYGCGGKFLDNGELQKIRAQYENNAERVADLRQKVDNNFTQLYQEFLTDNYTDAELLENKESDLMTYERKSAIMNFIEKIVNR